MGIEGLAVSRKMGTKLLTLLQSREESSTYAHHVAFNKFNSGSAN